MDNESSAVNQTDDHTCGPHDQSTYSAAIFFLFVTFAVGGEKQPVQSLLSWIDYATQLTTFLLSNYHSCRETFVKKHITTIHSRSDSPGYANC